MDKDTHNLYERMLQVITEGKHEETKAPKAADLDKDGKLSEYEKAKSDAILKNDDDPDNDKHICATKVEHRLFGKGDCVFAEHADPDESGYVSWYTVQFEHGTEVINTKDMDVLQESHHGSHKKK